MCVFSIEDGNIHFGIITHTAVVQIGGTDGRPQVIDDGHFGMYDPIHWTQPDAEPELKTWLEMPSDRHNRGCNFSFVDGHVEHWRWRWPKVFEEDSQRPANDLDKADLQRLQACLPTQ